MPSYEYVCGVCSTSHIVSRSIHEESGAPLCCGELASRKWEAPPVQFNAPGFYSSDNKRM